MRNKLKYIVIVLLAALSILVGVKDYNTTMDAKHTIEQIYDEAEGDLSKSQKAKIKKYDDLIKDRWYTLFFVCFYFGVVTVLTLSAGKRKKEQKRISQEEAKAIISEISKELIENNYVVTGNGEEVSDDYFITTIKAPKLHDAWFEENGVVFSWEKSEKADGYIILRKVGNKKWKKLKEIVGNENTTYRDYKVASNTTYVYTVKAYKDVDDRRIVSNKDSLGKEVFVEKGNIFAAPTLSVAVNDNGKKVIVWKPIFGALSYKIMRRTPGEKWQKLKIVNAEDICEFFDSSAQAGDIYEYTVSGIQKVEGQTDVGKFDKAGVGIEW